MFTELPKLFDRNFVIGYFLPVVLYACLAISLLQFLGIGTEITHIILRDLLVGTTILGLFSWTVGILLVGINRDILRILEGYGRFNPLKRLEKSELRRYKRLEAKIHKFERIKSQQDLSPSETERLNILYRKRVRRFPDQEKFVLPTSFGNTIRAFEVYPRLMYGIDPIVGWPRLWAVIPKDYRDLILGSKTHMDFWVNLGFLNIFFILEIIGIIVYALIQGISLQYWIIGADLFVATVIGALCLYRATKAALLWGDTIKSAFDLYLPDLAKKLDFVWPISRAQEKILWKEYGIAVDFARDDYLPERKYDQKPTSE